MSRNSGAPDANAKPSITVIDHTTNNTFAVEGNKNLGTAYVQVLDGSGNPITNPGSNTNITQVGGVNVPTLGLIKALPVEILDGSGNQITSFGGGASSTTTLATLPIDSFLRRNGSQFILKGERFRFVGANYYPLITGATSKADVQTIMNSAKGKGISVLRAWCFDPPGLFRTLSFVTGTNLITNPSFETNTNGYTSGSGGAINGSVYTRTNSDAYDGSWSMKQVSAYNSYDGLSYKVNVTANTDYVWTIWYKLTNTPGSSSQLPPVQWVGDATNSVSGHEVADGGIMSPTSVWTQRQVAFNSGNNTSINLNIFNYGGQNVAYYDNFNLSLRGASTLNYNESTFQQLDMVLDEARKRDIKLWLSLADGNENNYNSKGQYVRWANILYNAGLPDSFPWYDFFTNTYCKNLYKDFIKTLISRVNTINGRQYKDDPSVGLFELGNELRANKFGTNDNTLSSSILAAISQPGGWADEMSTYIKSIDPNHLVSFGDMGHSYQYLQDNSAVGDAVYNGTYYGVDYGILSALPNIDVLDFHLYPDQADNVHLLAPGGHYWGQAFGYNNGVSGDGLRAQLKDYVKVGHANNKPVVMSEVGFVSGTVGDNTYYPLYNRYQAFKAIFTDFLDIPGGDGVLPWSIISGATNTGSYDIALDSTGGGALTDNSDDTTLVNLIASYNTALQFDVKYAEPISGLIQTNGDIVSIDLNKSDSIISVQLADTWTGTVQFESTIDGITWYSHRITDNAGINVTSTTITGLFTGAIGGISKFRVRASTAITGNLTVNIQSSQGIKTSPLLGTIVGPGEDYNFNTIIARPKYLPFFFNAFNAGQSVYIQGNRILGSVLISQPGSPGTLLKIYDNYYQAVGQIYQFDTSIVNNYILNSLFVSGIYIVISGSGTSPSLTLHIA